MPKSKQMNAFQFAKQLLEKAKQNEPIITQDLLKIASLINIKIVGLENRFKSEDSLVRKLSDYVMEKGLPIKVVAKRNNDVLRYTYLLSENDYGTEFESLQKYLELAGYRISKIFNAWSLAETEADIGYRGLNLTVISSLKQRFELQLHTVESFVLKTETHSFYEEFRSPQTPRHRKTEIVEMMIKKASQLKKPKGI